MKTESQKGIVDSVKERIESLLNDNRFIREQLGLDNGDCLGDFLGGGGFGYVYGLTRQDGSPKNEVLKFAHTGIYSRISDAIHIGKMYEVRAVAEIIKELQNGGVEEEQHIVKPISSATGSDNYGEYYLIRMRKETPLVKGGTPDRTILSIAHDNNQVEELAIRVGLDISTALDFLHRKGYVHRDIKPNNIFYSVRSSDDEFSFLLGDFDTCRKAESNNSEYIPHTIVLTKGYCPLQWKETLDPVRDIYALGATLYVVLDEFQEEQMMQLSYNYIKPNQKLEDDWFVPPKHGSERLHQIIRKSMIPDAELNYKSIQEMHRDLKRLYAESKKRNTSLSSDLDAPYIFKKRELPIGTDNKTANTKNKNDIQKKLHSVKACAIVVAVLLVTIGPFALKLGGNDQIEESNLTNLIPDKEIDGLEGTNVEDQYSQEARDDDTMDSTSVGDEPENNSFNEYEGEESDFSVVEFHNLKLIDTNDEVLFGDHYCDEEITTLYGEMYTGYYELVSYGGSRRTEAFTEVLTNENYSRLTGTIFADEGMMDGDAIEFLVYTDGNLIYSSGLITRRDDPISFEVDITGARTVTIKSRSDDYHLMDTNPRIIATNLLVHTK